MKTKDQQLLEEAYDNVNNAKVVRYATPEELKAMKEFDKLPWGEIDFSKGWVWGSSGEPKFTYKTYISVKDKNPVQKGDFIYDYVTYSFKHGAISWYGRWNKVYPGSELESYVNLTTNAIESFELTNELPELKGVF